ncbi:hybrid sensor histidine kinase/response regulator [Burkholderia pseudomultivorans]|uniref:hybrid sensor histidine kinase/response regulator n=1 Tax=Burkholderia pseudomultivorans TaxID=1207504 RepID=UPI00075649A5|nr:hybrid sensor histidine kinase/response regulator [Burkholderia pseudomultivorans]KVC40111.1 hybrid sensor histidine kinase/response regulator [Burkholderia pseudomultivorans]
MQRLLHELGESPLEKFHSLETNLRRERSVFAIVIVLLIAAAASVAAASIAGLFETSFRHEEQAARIHEKDVVDELLQRRVVLTTATLVLQLRMGEEQNGVSRPEALHSCTEMPGVVTQSKVLRESCDDAMQLLASSGQATSIAMILADGTAAYGHLFAPNDFMSLHSGSPASMVNAIVARLNRRGINPLEAAQSKQIIWFVAGGGGDATPHLIGASLIAKDDQLYALVLTSVDARNLVTPLERSGQVQEPVIIDAEGVPLIEAADSGLVHRIDERLELRQDGLYHWIAGFGWALRRPPLIAGFGHMIYLLPLEVQLRALRYELMLICGAALVVIVLLCVAYRYWNYRFLSRIYAEASRALDTEMLNHLLVHATPVGLCIVRRENLEIIVANPIARTVMGLRITENQLPGELIGAFEKSLQGVQSDADGSRIFQFPFTLSRPKRPPLHIEITYAPAKLNKQDVFFCAVIDMTSHHQAEILLREAKLTSDAAAKAKVAFFASMSHEIRTPLSSLVGNIELVARGPLAPEQQARVQAMQTSARGLLQIVNDVLDFSKIDVGELSLMEEWCSVVELLEKLAQSHAPLAVQQGLMFYTVFDRDIPSRLLFDPIRVSQIVNNLLSNALKFTPSGKIVLRASWGGGVLVLSVTDSGIGIPEELKQRLFVPFSQGDSNRLAQARGTGLGLSICARLCELMKGRIRLDSAVGVGTRITVELPLKTSEAGQESERALPYRRPVILCRAQENLEWLSSLFDPAVTVITAVANPGEPIDASVHDVLLVTDEYTESEVLEWWRRPGAILWLSRSGPIIPARREDGGVGVSIYSLAGMRSAAALLGTSPQQALESGTDRRTSEGKLSVLVVEDNVLNRHLLVDQLGTFGVLAIEATNGEEALALLAKEPVKAVMTDIDMPVMDGFQLLSEMRRLGYRIPVYAVSASARPEDIAQGLARGFTDYLAKPVPLDVLEKVVGDLSAPSRTEADQDRDETVPGVPSVPDKYVPGFLEQARKDIDEFATLIRGRDVSRLRRWLHGVAGGLSVLGPSELYEQCQELRSYVRESEGWDEEMEAQAQAIRDTLEGMVSALRH